VTLHVQYNEADYREANAAVRGQRLQSIGLAPFFFVFLAFAAGIVIGNLLQERPPGEPPRGPVDVIIWTLPLLFVAVYWAVIAFRTGGKRAYGFVTPPPRLSGLGAVLPMLLGAAVFTVSLLATAYTPPGPPPQDQPPMSPGRALAVIFLPMLPIASMVVCSIVMVLRLNARNIRRAFELQAHLHRPKTIEVSPESLTVSGEGVREDYAWHAFIGWNETAHLFLLFTSYVTFHIVPKRAFASRDAYDEFEMIVRNKVGERRHGFDVLPPARSAVPPPLPDSHRRTVP
jgi:hypothetical protein